MTNIALPSAAGVRRVAANAGFLLLAYVFPRGLTFAAIVVAARVLGAEQFGYYGTAGAYAVILAIVAALGMMPLLVREIAQAPARGHELVRAAHLAKTLTGSLMLLALVLVAVFVLDYPGSVVASATLLGTAYAISAFGENLGAYFQARERMDVWFRAAALYGMVTGSVGVILVAATGSVVAFCAAPVAGQLVAVGWLVSQLPAAAPALPRFSPTTWRNVGRLFKQAAPFAASFVVLTLFYKSDVLLLARWRESAEVGFYTAGYKFADITVALATVAVGAVYPRLSRAAPRATGQGEWAASRMAELALLGSVPVASVLWLARHDVVGALYGPAYAATGSVVGFIAPALPAVTFNLFAGYMLGAFGRMSWTAAAYSMGLLVKVALNWLWIPGAGAAGAARAMFTAEWLVAAAFMVALAHAVGAVPRLRAVAIVAGAALGAAAMAQLAGVLGAVGAAMSYAVLVAALYWTARAVPPEERALVRRAVAELRERGAALPNRR